MAFPDRSHCRTCAEGNAAREELELNKMKDEDELDGWHKVQPSASLHAAALYPADIFFGTLAPSLSRNVITELMRPAS